MATVFDKVVPIDTNAWLEPGNTRIRVRVTAVSGSNNSLVWSATPVAAETLFYKHTFTPSGAPSSVKVTEYRAYGEEPVYFKIKLTYGSNNSVSTSAQKVAVGSVSTNNVESSKGWHSYGYTSEVVSITTTGSYTDYTVDVIAICKSTQVSARANIKSSTPVTPPSPEPTGGSTEQVWVKVNGHWVQETGIWIKVNGHWVQETGIWVKVNGHWVQS